VNGRQQMRMSSAETDFMSENFAEMASTLAEIGRSFYQRGWALGTSGNFSASVNRDPLRLAITPSGVDKGQRYGPGPVSADFGDGADGQDD